MANKKNPIKGEFPMTGCPGKIEVPTPKEKEALDAMRSIKDRVRLVKQQLRLLKSTDPDKDHGKIMELEKELANLKADWDRWERKRNDAVKERMIILGHEEGP